MSEVNYRRNGMKYSTADKSWGMVPVMVLGAGGSVLGAKGPSRERRAAKRGK